MMQTKCADAAKRDKREAALRKQFRAKRARTKVVLEGRRTMKLDAVARLDLSGPFPRIAYDAPVQVSASGTTLVVVPDTTARDKRKAFKHWCATNGISLVPCERIGGEVPTVRKGESLAPGTDVTAFQAFGEVDSLERLKAHKYVNPADGRGKWYYLTNASAGANVGTLARKPVSKIPYRPAEPLHAVPEYTHDELEAMYSKLADDTCRRLFGTELFDFLAYCDDECAYFYASPVAAESVYMLWTAARIFWQATAQKTTEPTNEQLASIVAQLNG